MREGPWRCQPRQSFVLKCRVPAALGAAFCIQPDVRSSASEYLHPPGRPPSSHKLSLRSSYWDLIDTRPVPAVMLHHLSPFTVSDCTGWRSAASACCVQ